MAKVISVVILQNAKGWQFVDTDRVLEGRFGLPIAEIFKKIGEKAFRRAEMDVLKRYAYTMKRLYL